MTVIGKQGWIVTPIKGAGHPGEVKVAGMIMLAYAPTPIDRGQPVIIIDDRGPNSVEVSAL